MPTAKIIIIIVFSGYALFVEFWRNPTDCGGLRERLGDEL